MNNHKLITKGKMILREVKLLLPLILSQYTVSVKERLLSKLPKPMIHVKRKFIFCVLHLQIPYNFLKSRKYQSLK